jgi:glycosyltransferase involved in cell wall biosynthesis
MLDSSNIRGEFDAGVTNLAVLSSCVTLYTSLPATLSRAANGREIGRVYQKACITSWRRAGFDIISVNAASEIEELRSAGFDIAFLEVERSPPSIGEILDAVRRGTSDVAGIINADCLIIAPGGAITSMIEAARNGIVIAERMNLDPETLRLTGESCQGFDLFLFGKDHIEGSSFDHEITIGAPWWDYWFPLSHQQAGGQLYLNSSPVMLHLDHKRSWSQEAYVIQGRRCYEKLSSNNSACLRFPFIDYDRTTWEDEDLVGFSQAAFGWLKGNSSKLGPGDEHAEFVSLFFSSLNEVTGAQAAAISSTAKLPLLSFIVVNHNYGRFLRACVKSIMSQTYRNIECIVVDNASTDESTAVLQELVTQFPTLRVAYNKENVGQSAACATGFALTNAQYVAFIDADDYLLPDFAATHIRAHLSLRIPVGFTSSDMAELVNDKIVIGGAAHFGRRATLAIGSTSTSQALRDIKEVSKILGTTDLESNQFHAKLRSVKKTNTDWVWSAMSGGVYRADAIRMFAFNPKLRSLPRAADCYFNFGINALSGSVLIEKALAVYRIHGQNNFMKRAALQGTIAFRREADEGAKAAYFALEHMIAEFEFFYRQCESPIGLWVTLQTLHKKAGEFKWKWGERALSHAMKFYFLKVITYLRRRFYTESGDQPGKSAID